jgi:REP element-mobilizing transposase RayT
MKYSDLGKIVVQCWLDIPKHYPDVILDEFVVMPDHIHGIIQIKRRHVGAQTPIVGAQNFLPLQRVNRFHKIIPGSIGSIIRGFKIGVTKWCNANGYEFFRWQKNYYLAIIFDDSALLRVRKYILDNFKNWKSKN